VAGLTLGGGLGWLSGEHGAACDNLLSAEVVTADGQVVTASDNQNELIVLGCFRAGPDFTDHAHDATSATLYALFLPGADQHACPDGTQAHDHIVSAVPGSPGYATLWNLKAVVPGPAFNQSIMPITSERALLNAEAFGQVVIMDTGVPLKGVIVGPRS
jgi:hypothetical protein